MQSLFSSLDLWLRCCATRTHWEL